MESVEDLIVYSRESSIRFAFSSKIYSLTTNGSAEASMIQFEVSRFELIELSLKK